jgi:hypothetical protein
MWRMLAQAVFLLPLAVVLRKRLRGAMFSPVVALSGDPMTPALSIQTR